MRHATWAVVAMVLLLYGCKDPAEFMFDQLSDAIPIESLTPERAKSLVHDLHDYGKDVLDLCCLTTLDADTAKALAEFKGKRLALTGLTTLLSADRAGVYSRTEGASRSRVRRVVREPGVN